MPIKSTALIDVHYPLFRYVVIATTGGVLALTSVAPVDGAGLSEKSSWLLGNFTQNAPCKGDGSDPAELKVRNAAGQIESKSGVCNLKEGGGPLSAHFGFRVRCYSVEGFERDAALALCSYSTSIV
jgi:hypothetical protein